MNGKNHTTDPKFVFQMIVLFYPTLPKSSITHIF